MAGTISAGVQYEDRGAVALLRIDRPPLNVLDIPSIAALDAAMARAEESAAAVLVLSSAGAKAFSAGVDVKDHTPDKLESMILGFHRLFRRLQASRLVSVAAVKGACLGGGMELALSCDLVVAEETAKFALPEIRLACFPPVGIAVLADRYGPRLAELCLTGESIPGAEAHRRGLLSRLVPEGKAEETALEMAASMGAGSRAVLGITVRHLRRLALPHFEKSLEKAERAYLEELARTPDMDEGIRAFMEKRPPRYGSGTAAPGGAS
ncbi:MAG: enoyl-CoA hydratase/isomerase family protein [Planctomycetaceae bacterium]|nr:enoyl-CoA hydratase/isomerase family protein [Planctomycetota bacterium]NUN53095.1 enoyl-CoA hydratase/isomerase family protein [Planctomycetaceae bacterium]